MMSLGTLLVKHGWITKQQLGLAISKQREIGGRLGTCLLEMGAIAEELLDRSLAEQQGVPSVAAEELREISSKVAGLLPAPIAIRYRAIPFRASNSDVDIAMLEVDNLWLQDELSFIVGRRLNVYIANEARIVAALAKYYRAPCSEIFVKLLMHLDRELDAKSASRLHPESRLVQSEEHEGPTKPEGARSEPTTAAAWPSPDLDRAAPSPIHLSEQPDRAHSIPVTVQELASLGAAQLERNDVQPQPVVPYSRDAGVERVMSLEETEVAIDTSSEPNEIGRLLIVALSQLMTRVVLLKVTPVSVRGWLAEGPGLNRDRLERFEVDFDQPSIFLNLRSGGSFFLGTLPDMAAHSELLSCWHKDLADECAVFPVRVRDRLVALVYGDCGPLGLADLDLDRVRGLCNIASRAFERCIVERKKKSQLRVE